MGLQCSILGHSFEPAGVEREREEQGSEVVTTEREIERCRRCGTERVVSESTEVTAVVDGEAVGLEDDSDADAGVSADTGADAGDTAGGGLAGAVDRSDADRDDGAEADDDAGRSPAATADDRGSASGLSEDAYDDRRFDDEPPDPETEDAEILTDDDPESERAPGQWPDDTETDDEPDSDDVVDESDGRGEADDAIDVADGEDETTPEIQGEESLSGITVPEGEIVCPECGFRIQARSGYRGGDSCPECSAWLEAERNQ